MTNGTMDHRLRRHWSTISAMLIDVETSFWRYGVGSSVSHCLRRQRAMRARTLQQHRPSYQDHAELVTNGNFLPLIPVISTGPFQPSTRLFPFRGRRSPASQQMPPLRKRVCGKQASADICLTHQSQLCSYDEWVV